MANFEINVINIRKLYSTIFHRDSEVILYYRPELGVTKPWVLKCDNREISHENFELAAEIMFKTLKVELEKKINSDEEQTKNLKKILGSINGN